MTLLNVTQKTPLFLNNSSFSFEGGLFSFRSQSKQNNQFEPKIYVWFRVKCAV